MRFINTEVNLYIAYDEVVEINKSVIILTYKIIYILLLETIIISFQLMFINTFLLCTFIV